MPSRPVRDLAVARGGRLQRGRRANACYTRVHSVTPGFRSVPRRPNAFAGPYLDRTAHLRKDATFVEQSLRAAGTRIVPVCHSRNLVQRGEVGWSAVFLENAAALHGALPSADFVLLGQFDGLVYFAAEIADAELATQWSSAPEARFEDLRFTGGQMPAQEAGVLAYARAMLYWRERHRHCGVCGAANAPSSAGHVMKCSNESCATDHFPRLDPAIIVLVTDGERALLGRQASWPAGRYSTIAGSSRGKWSVAQASFVHFITWPALAGSVAAPHTPQYRWRSRQ